MKAAAISSGAGLGLGGILGFPTGGAIGFAAGIYEASQTSGGGYLADYVKCQAYMWNPLFGAAIGAGMGAIGGMVLGLPAGAAVGLAAAVEMTPKAAALVAGVFSAAGLGLFANHRQVTAARNHLVDESNGEKHHRL